RRWLRADDDRKGFGALREAIAQYLGSSRGVRCSADQIVMVSGIQQALDLLARFLLKPGDEVWMEDPGYFGACVAFGNAGANFVPGGRTGTVCFRRYTHVFTCQGSISDASSPVPAWNDNVVLSWSL